MDRFLLIKTSDDVGMSGASCTELFCTILKNGTISLRVCRNQYQDGGRFFFDSVRGIRTPLQFVDAISLITYISEVTRFKPLTISIPGSDSISLFRIISVWNCKAP